MKKSLKIVGVIIILISVFLLFFYLSYGRTVMIDDVFLMSGEFYSKNELSVFYEVIAGRGCSECSKYDKKRKIKGADPKTFEIINSHYTKDKNNFYVCTWTGPDLFRISTKCIKIKSVDRESFEIIDNDSYGDYAKDKNNVYYEGIIIKNADNQSFKVLDYRYAKDKNNCYKYGEMTDVSECEKFKK